MVDEEAGKDAAAQGAEPAGGGADEAGAADEAASAAKDETAPAAEQAAREDAATAPEPEQLADAPVPSAEEMRGWRGYKLDDMHGTKTAKVLGVMADAESGEPQWLLVRVGLFGHHTLVPARTAVAAGERVWVPHTREEVRQAPKLDPDSSVKTSTERALLAHYGLSGAKERMAELAKRSEDQPSVELFAG